MTLVDLNFSLLNVLNKVKVDKFGRVSAFLAINKNPGPTSHDIVDQVRKILKIRNVGHVGALDPFASGILLILAGKEYTSLSEQLMQLDKAYEAEVLVGVTTDSLDIEGKVVEVKIPMNVDSDLVKAKLKDFEGGYDQYVPVFSSVKVNGQKLRVLARQSESFEIVNEQHKRFVQFKQKDRNLKIELPQKSISISDVRLLGIDNSVNKSNNDFLNKNNIEGEFLSLKIHLNCSKGTYIRQFAYDLGQKLGLPAMLTGLKRTRIGQITIENAISIDEVKL